LEEFFGLFHGTARRLWCLTDGGHFDNTGAYELIRRRLPLIVVIDAEADPEGTFQGLGNLVRKVRMDFCAEIRFLDDEHGCRLAERKGEEEKTPAYLDTLAALRPRWTNQRSVGGAGAGEGGGQGLSEPGGRRLRSLAHAAVAGVHYDGQAEPTSILVYVKPTLLGDEPVDIGHYHSENPDFPHQRTVDQFFDEAQWESYRKLGELIAERVFSRKAFKFYCDKAEISGLA
jgi:hypothetical protein